MRAPDINKAVDILKVIGWVKSAWEEVAPDTIKHCFEKCGFPTEDYAAVSIFDFFSIHSKKQSSITDFFKKK